MGEGQQRAEMQRLPSQQRHTTQQGMQLGHYAAHTPGHTRQHAEPHSAAAAAVVPCNCMLQVTAAEGFGKVRLFEILDDLETKTRPIMEAARQRLAKEKGQDALQPHNISHALAGGGKICCKHLAVS